VGESEREGGRERKERKNGTKMLFPSTNRFPSNAWLFFSSYNFIEIKYVLIRVGY